MGEQWTPERIAEQKHCLRDVGGITHWTPELSQVVRKAADIILQEGNPGRAFVLYQMVATIEFQRAELEARDAAIRVFLESPMGSEDIAGFIEDIREIQQTTSGEDEDE